MIQNPKFEIGQRLFLRDYVEHYVDNHNRKYDTYSNQPPIGHRVTSIHIEICSGGTQIFYRFSPSLELVSEDSLVTEIPNMNKKNE